MVWLVSVHRIRRVTFCKLDVAEALNVAEVPDNISFLFKCLIGLPFVNSVAELLFWSIVLGAETAEGRAVDVGVFA